MINLKVEVQGEGLPILCLHGHPGSGRCMSVFTHHLSQNFQTLSPDLRGYGKSRPKGHFIMDDHIYDLEVLLEQFGIESCLLLGWSLGGILALELALKFPQRFQGLILIATAASPQSNHPPIFWQDNLYTAIAGIINLIVPGWQWNIETFGKRSLFRYLLQQHTPTAYQYLAKEGTPAYFQTSQAANHALSHALKKGYNRLDDLRTLPCPTLVLAGENDCHITAQSSRKTAQYLPQSEWKCYPNTAHLFPWEIPEQMLEDIDLWLKHQKL